MDKRKKSLLKILEPHIESGVMVVNLRGESNPGLYLTQLREDLTELGYSSKDFANTENGEVHHIHYRRSDCHA